MARVLESTARKLPRAAARHPAARDVRRGLDSAATHGLLAGVGFLLVPGAPFDHGPAYLMVAIRPRPTRRHFDPERIEYWAIERGRATPTQLEWFAKPVEQRFGWGVIKVVDRVAATNYFASFGGRLTASRDGEVSAALFRSDAPILALGGQSGPPDPLAANVAAYFATLRAAAGADAALAAWIDSLDEQALYTAFVQRAIATYRRADAEAALSPRLMSVLRRELCRVEGAAPDAAADGIELALRLSEPI